jgi:transcriptional regulator with XRE-family HTH domain
MERDPVTRVLAENIERIMLDRGMSQAELQRAAGLSQSGIHDIFKGRLKSPKVETVARIAQALQVNVADLFLDPIELQGRKAILAAYGTLSPEKRGTILAIALALAGQPDTH